MPTLYLDHYFYFARKCLGKLFADRHVEGDLLLSLWLETNVERRSPSTIYELRLRPHVRWTEDTVDNEHMNRKRSKSSCPFMHLRIECCIYHKPHEFGESSSDCSSDESDWVDSSDLEK